MKKIRDYVIVFSLGQQRVLYFFCKLHLIHPTAGTKLYHPITNELEALVQEYDARIIFSNLLLKLVNLLETDACKEAAQRLINCGVIE